MKLRNLSLKEDFSVILFSIVPLTPEIKETLHLAKSIEFLTFVLGFRKGFKTEQFEKCKRKKEVLALPPT